MILEACTSFLSFIFEQNCCSTWDFAYVNPWVTTEPGISGEALTLYIHKAILNPVIIKIIEG